PSASRSLRDALPILDLWFVLGLGWGVAGAARASVVAEWSGLAIGLLLCRGELARHPGRLPLAPLRRWGQWRPLLAVNRDILIRSDRKSTRLNSSHVK